MLTCDLVSVIWVENNQVGVEFLCIAPESLPQFLTLVDNRISLALED